MLVSCFGIFVFAVNFEVFHMIEYFTFLSSFFGKVHTRQILEREGQPGQASRFVV
jgi:hypothetical protein